jgi:hypothetical protein
MKRRVDFFCVGDLAGDCHVAYEAAAIQPGFEKLLVHEDREITHQFAQPFKILMNPSLTRRLSESTRAAQRTKQQKRLESASLWSKDAKNPAFDRVFSSNF